MKNLIAALALAILLRFLCASSAAATPAEKAGGIGRNTSIAAVIEEIKRSQNTDNVFEIDPDTVNDELLEKTGEAVMKNMPANPRLHQLLDSIAVGNGLASLKAVRRVMGYHYLNGDFYGGPGNLTGPDLLCEQVSSGSLKSGRVLNVSAPYVALSWFLTITLALTCVYLLLRK